MALRKRGGIWYFRKTINGQLFRESTGFADKIRAAMPPGEHTDAMLSEMLACPPELIRHALDRLGDPEEYLTKHGLPAEAITALRAALIER